MAPQGDWVRTSAKAVIVRDNSILLVRHGKDGDTWFTLPGGGQNKFETLEAALVRECREETGYAVRMGELVFVGEYIGKNHEFAPNDSDVHQIDLHFLCEIAGNEAPIPIAVPDNTQVGIEWVETGEIPDAPLYPKYLRKKIPDYLGGLRDNPYVGDVN